MGPCFSIDPFISSLFFLLPLNSSLSFSSISHSLISGPPTLFRPAEASLPCWFISRTLLNTRGFLTTLKFFHSLNSSSHETGHFGSSVPSQICWALCSNPNPTATKMELNRIAEGFCSCSRTTFGHLTLRSNPFSTSSKKHS